MTPTNDSSGLLSQAGKANTQQIYEQGQDCMQNCEERLCFVAGLESTLELKTGIMEVADVQLVSADSVQHPAIILHSQLHPSHRCPGRPECHSTWHQHPHQRPATSAGD